MLKCSEHRSFLKTEIICIHCSLPDILKQKLFGGYFSWGFHNMMVSGSLKLYWSSDLHFCPADDPHSLVGIRLEWTYSMLFLSCFSWMAVCSPVCCHLTVSLHSSSWLGMFFDGIVFDNIFQDIFDTCRDKELLVLFLLSFSMCTSLL